MRKEIFISGARGRQILMLAAPSPFGLETPAAEPLGARPPLPVVPVHHAAPSAPRAPSPGLAPLPCRPARPPSGGLAACLWLPAVRDAAARAPSGLRMLSLKGRPRGS